MKRICYDHLKLILHKVCQWYPLRKFKSPLSQSWRQINLKTIASLISSTQRILQKSYQRRNNCRCRLLLRRPMQTNNYLERCLKSWARGLTNKRRMARSIRPCINNFEITSLSILIVKKIVRWICKSFWVEELKTCCPETLLRTMRNEPIKLSRKTI